MVTKVKEQPTLFTASVLLESGREYRVERRDGPTPRTRTSIFSRVENGQSPRGEETWVGREPWVGSCNDVCEESKGLVFEKVEVTS